MEESIKGDGLYSYLTGQFQLQEVDVKTYSPLTLAYIGDSVYDMLIKTLVVRGGNSQVNKLHKRTAAMVKAKAQSDLFRLIEPELTAEELAIYKRGRNAKSATSAKNATMIDYRRATGFETLIGYLYLKNDFKRIVDLVKLGLECKKGIWGIK